ncbi:MOSC domain-containing protein [Mycobacterium sp. PS03-16]|uniref:MOSC and FAD-binding oxidoreductase domain-containing protein n=1 Tax=Mycobacterium sp. PS03-16 TaxID=2559611 RepID=UPI0010747F77|nr:MOSC and FAD-binding oxidoreductase domain-containing protein [Mycobacterium sp. PS03-16]TFV59659.1 MOSC domain-containing protein [Mycobacterium sp. PS03-16]
MATLVSVNVGLPKDVAWLGRTVFTGAWKAPVDGPRMAGRLNIDGDGQGDLGGHGGEQRAVLVYQLDSYRHWARILGRDDLRPGHFGENFTVDGLPDDEVCIGDRYRIGGAVLEVTQPRVTCYRVGLRLGEPRMAALLVSHRRPGFYCRVIEQGLVEAGRSIDKISDGPEHVTVAEIDALLYLPGHPRDALERALRIDALSPGWRASLESLVAHGDGEGNAGLTEAAKVPPPAWAGFRRMAVTEVHDESRSVVALTLADPDGAALPEWLPGQSVALRLSTAPGAAPMIRTYSLSNQPGASSYRIGVKVEPHGLGSTFIREHVRAGQHLDVSAPRGVFYLGAGDHPILLLSAGVGVTPVLAMLHALVGERSTREVWWVHGARDGSEHPFAVESRALVDQLVHGHWHVRYSRPRLEDLEGADYTAAGRIGPDVIDALGVPRDAEAYLCGPDSFMRQMSNALVDAGYAPSRVHVETFGAGAALTPGIAARTGKAPHPPQGPPGTGPEVSFARSAVIAPFGSAYPSLLELAEACDVPTRWSCRTGVCHNCETALLSGAVSYDPEPLEPPAAGNVLICCSRPVEPVVLDL